MSDETTVEPTPVATPATAPVPAAPVPTPGATGPGRTRKATGTLGQVVGIVGLVVCLALVVGVLLGYGWATGAVSDVEGALDAAVARVDPLVETAATRVDAVAQRVAEVAAAAEAVATDPNATPEALQAVIDGLGAISARYLELRGTYAGAREQVVSALDRLALVDRFVPGVSVPQGPIDALASLDASVQGIDAVIMELIDAGGAVQALNATATLIAEKARAVEAGLGAITTGLEELQGRLADLRAEIAGIAGTVRSIITIVAVVLVVALLYVALLHLVLFRSSRRLARGPGAG